MVCRSLFNDCSRRRLKSTTFGTGLRSEREYNGLNWRTAARFDAALDTGLDQERVMYYDQSWRLLEERIDDDSDAEPGDGADRALQYVWGMRHIDDIAFRRVNSNFGNDDPDITYESSSYYATDALFSVVALLQGRQAVLGERVQYDAYGAARHQRSGDVDGDGDTDGADNAAYLTVFNATIDQATYNVDADINRDGVINGTDGTLLTNNFGAALPKGQLSNADNVIGFDAYVFNAPDEVYTVRNRSYDFHQGRWLERDPKGYIDGNNVYAYAKSSPIIYSDPKGLACTKDTDAGPAGEDCKSWCHSSGNLGGTDCKMEGGWICCLCTGNIIEKLDDQTQNIGIACVEAHELAHVANCGLDITDECDRCEAYTAELKCIDSNNPGNIIFDCAPPPPGSYEDYRQETDQHRQAWCAVCSPPSP